ncbi:elongation factor P 5-aminopentanone reductase [Alkalihalobacillus hemicellulosilyticus]|uniref:3-oxoacyl-[acyl-carrier protein] reductase n=1 Tax=Halalkalibacter hemicellulosilyticusJCM 9152 TaxID=1236971 RepID=W4QGN9_9BACI|nr:SDR family NAD(P)-dependent oxidoreductase [Halalkalibacter hemicellulosilyticus]GAE30818.1 3-oxoacyl-[acyl-carrier protein] reductase [Halalkalibacter hemicellulosilyticusJCM 9152]
MKEIVITGASGGIGAEIAKELASPESSLFLHYHRNEEMIHKVKEACLQKGATVKLIQADLTAQEGAEQLVEGLVEAGNVYSVIHNAGMSEFQLFTSTTDMHLDSLLNIHLMNPMKITRALLPIMLRAKKGKIIMISSIWGLTGASCEVTYSAAKGGMNSFVKALAKEVAPNNIQVNGVAPGAIDTSMLTEHGREHIELLKEEIPANRLGSTKEVSQLVAFLHSNQANYINGQIISVNGAWYC